MKQSLKDTFKMKDLGHFHHCLGVYIHLGKKGISLCQTLYIQRLLKKYGLSEANTASGHSNGYQCKDGEERSAQ